MAFDIVDLISSRGTEKAELYGEYVNPWVVSTAQKFGLDKHFTRAEGPYVYDDEDNRYLDMDGGLGVFCLGRNHPRLAGTIHSLLDLQTPSLINRDPHLLAGLLAEALATRAPGDINKVIFTNTGSETVEAALKMARKVTGRKKLLYIHGDFHGTTYGALSVTGTSDQLALGSAFGPLVPDVVGIPHDDVEQLTKELSRGDVAGFIVEPVVGATVRPLSKEFMRTAQELCRKHGTMFIVDEVLVGFGRSGSMFASDHYEVLPDMLLLSKALSGGMIPVGAVLVRDDVHARGYDQQGVFVHRSTYVENDLAMGAGLASIHIIEEEGLIQNVAHQGRRLLDGLEVLRDRYSMIREVRGVGLLAGIELGAPSGVQRVSGRMLEKRGILGHMVAMQLIEKHRIIAAPTRERNVLRVHPPFVLTDADVDHFLESLDSVMRAAHRWPDGVGWYLLGKTLRDRAAARSSSSDQMSLNGQASRNGRAAPKAPAAATGGAASEKAAQSRANQT